MDKVPLSPPEYGRILTPVWPTFSLLPHAMLRMLVGKARSLRCAKSQGPVMPTEQASRCPISPRQRPNAPVSCLGWHSNLMLCSLQARRSRQVAGTHRATCLASLVLGRGGSEPTALIVSKHDYQLQFYCSGVAWKPQGCEMRALVVLLMPGE